MKEKDIKEPYKAVIRFLPSEEEEIYLKTVKNRYYYIDEKTLKIQQQKLRKKKIERLYGDKV